MQCYECAKQGVREDAVVACWSCSAGLCLRHVAEAAVQRSGRELVMHCAHDTWEPAAATTLTPTMQ